MRYPKDFVAKAKLLYPGSKDLHKVLDNGEVSVETHLSMRGRDSIKPMHVVEMISEGRINELKTEAQMILARMELYEEWRFISYKLMGINERK